MLERSIPAYNVMRDLTTRLASSFVLPGTDVVDLGCSRGQAVEPLVRTFGASVSRYALADVSAPMLDAARQRFRDDVQTGLVQVSHCDLRYDYPIAVNPGSPTVSVTLAVLTLQFTPIEYRHEIVQRIYDSTVVGGALMLVEKVLGEGSALHGRYDRLYLDYKRSQRYTDEQIARKKASLEGVLVSQTAHENERMLRTAGFRTVDAYYRWLNFAGWVAVR
jgi:tRNA (cmo5U34)-methyltransferase